MVPPPHVLSHPVVCVGVSHSFSLSPSPSFSLSLSLKPTIQGVFDSEPGLGLKLGQSKPTMPGTVPTDRHTTIPIDSGPIPAALFDDDPELLNSEIAQPNRFMAKLLAIPAVYIYTNGRIYSGTPIHKGYDGSYSRVSARRILQVVPNIT